MNPTHRRRRTALLAICSLALVGCAARERLDRAGDAYLLGAFAFNPGAGAAAGRHEHDGRGPDLSQARIDARVAEITRQRAALEPLAADTDKETSLRARALRAALAADLFPLADAAAPSRNPMFYAGAIDVSLYAKRDYAPIGRRMLAATRVLAAAPGVLETARAQLNESLPRVFITTAATIARGQAEFYEKDLPRAFESVGTPGARAELATAATLAASAMRGFADWLERERLAKATDDFAVGREAFARMLREQELITQTPEEILAVGERELERLKARFIAAAREIDPPRPAPDVWADVMRDHPTADSLIPETRAHLEEIHAFFKDRNLVRYPTDRRVIVDETPRFLRATSFASMDTPGPFETRATESYYYVTPVEPEWDAKRTEEWLTAFNYYTTDIVSVHEAYPGHFMQAMHLKDSGIPGAWRFIGSYAFIEGWAHYTEELAIEEGFPPASLAKAPHAAAKYRMAQASEALLRVCRLVAAIRMHCQGMTIDQATRFFMDNCYYAEATARAEAERGSYDPGYCLYTVGKIQLMTLRRDWKAQEGPAFSLIRFHDEVQRHGMPPVRLLRERMLKNPALWDRTIAQIE